MIRSDVLVIGAGLAGLMAAYTSAKQGKKVTLLTWGEGTLTVNSGTIDILGFDENHKRVNNPLQGIDNLPADHPYKKIGRQALQEGLASFLELTKQHELTYIGSMEANQPVVTAIGTKKRTTYAPLPMVLSEQALTKKKIRAVAIKGLKDFYGDVMIENLKKSFGPDKDYGVIPIDTGLMGGRDITIQDVARYLDTPQGNADFLSQLEDLDQDTLLVLPPIFGSHGHTVYQTISQEMKATMVETTCLPPSVPGIRLRYAFRDELRQLGVDIVESSKAVASEIEGTKAVSVIANSASNQRRYYADRFILATGGFYSGGIEMRDFEKPIEPIFHLPISFVKGEDQWTNEELFGSKAQGYAKTGIETNDLLQPVNKEGQVVLDNVYIVGRNLAGFDFCFEHSGNGIAIASAYKAASVGMGKEA